MVISDAEVSLPVEAKANAFLRLLDFFPAELRPLAACRNIDLSAVCLNADAVTKLRFVQEIISGEMSASRLSELTKFTKLMEHVLHVHRSDPENSSLSAVEIYEFEQLINILNS